MKARRKFVPTGRRPIPLRKNVSQRIPNGRTLQTRDEFLQSGKGYRKPGYENKGYYRELIVVDSNRKNEIAVIKGSSKGKDIEGLTKTKFKPFIEIKDDEGKPIKIGKKFIENKSSKDLSKHQVNQIKIELFKKSSKKLRKYNKQKIRNMKNR